jgi:hypothetical protein
MYIRTMQCKQDGRGIIMALQMVYIKNNQVKRHDNLLGRHRAIRISSR